MLTSYNGATLTYDEIGNPLSYRDGMTMKWESGRRLKRIDKSNTVIAYNYDENGMRAKKIVGGVTTTFELDGTKIIYQKNKADGSVISFMYDESGSPIGMNYAGAAYYYVKNLQGDIVGIKTATGTTVVTYAYDAWENIVAQNANSGYTALMNANPFRYRGYYYDNETGFYYLQSRYYDPKICRFINADSLLDTSAGVKGFNLFAYCGNNPVMNYDPAGHRYVECCPNGDCPECRAKKKQSVSCPVVDYFNPNTYTISGTFQDGIFKGSGSLTGGYSEFNSRLQINFKDNSNGMLGGYAKISGGNASGKIGIGNDDMAFSLKGIGDALTTTAQAGIQYKEGFGVAAKAKASVLSGRATAEIEIFGCQIELGVSGDLLSAGAEAMFGVFSDEGFSATASIGAGLFGVGFVFRVKPNQ